MTYRHIAGFLSILLFISLVSQVLSFDVSPFFTAGTYAVNIVFVIFWAIRMFGGLRTIEEKAEQN